MLRKLLVRCADGVTYETLCGDCIMGEVDKTSRSVSIGYYFSLVWALLSVSHLCANILGLFDLLRRSLDGDTNMLYGFFSIFSPIAIIAILYIVYLSDIKAKKYWWFLLAGMWVVSIGKLVLSQSGAWAWLPYAISAILATYAYLGFYKVRISETMDASMARKRNTYILLLGFLLAAIHFSLII